jgi:predicted negative regulator of RcsB-dependent stress response
MARKKEETVEQIAPDPIIDNLKKGATWVEKHFKQVIGVIVLLLGAVLAYEIISTSTERSAAAVTTQLNEAVKAYDEATDPQKVLTTTVTSVLDADLEKAREKLAAVAKDHPDSGAAQMAKLYEADVARKLRKYADSEALYKEYIQTAKPDDMALFVALEGIGYALEEQNKLDDALQQFSRIGEGSTAFYKDYGLKHKARILEKKGDLAGAKAALQAIVAIEPPSTLRPFAEERLKSLP